MFVLIGINGEKNVYWWYMIAYDDLVGMLQKVSLFWLFEPILSCVYD